MKTNVNTASFESLIQVKGIGKSTAQKIITAREQGNYLNSMDDLKAIGKINPRYEQEIKAVISFGKSTANQPVKKAVKPKPKKETATKPTPTEIIKPTVDLEYNFQVNIAGLIPFDGDNPFSDYQLIIHYKIINASNGNPIPETPLLM